MRTKGNTKREICNVPGCGRLHYAKGYCGPHYNRTRKPGGLRSETAIGDKSGPLNPNWKGGIVTRKDGRVVVYSPGHPYAHKDGHYVLRYRLEKEKELGRFLTPEEVVHHINETPSDDASGNIKEMLRGRHSTLHNRKRRLKNRSLITPKKCECCGAELVFRCNEVPSDFKGRRFCNRRCSRRFVASNRKAATPHRALDLMARAEEWVKGLKL